MSRIIDELKRTDTSVIWVVLISLNILVPDYWLL